MPTVRLYRQDEFPALLKWQAIAFMRVEWPFVFSGPGRFASETYPPEWEPVHIAAAEGDSLMSYAAVIRLALDHGGVGYRVAGFGNMFTFPPYRREGHGRRVLELATAFIRGSDADVAILFCGDELEPFYAACGWEVVAAPTYVGPGRHEHRCLRMMLFISDQGRAGRDDFANLPLVVEETW